MKKIIITMALAMLTITTVNAESWRNKNNRDNGRNNTTIIVNNDRRGNDVTVINNSRNSDVKVINRGSRNSEVKIVNRDNRSNNDRGFKVGNPHKDRPMVGQRVNEIPCGAVKVHRHGRDYYRVGNVLYDKIATATGIVYSIVELLNS